MDKHTFELLVVEDDLADVDLIKEALELRVESELDVKLSQVEDGENAIAFLRKKKPFNEAPTPDLVILDLNMPKKSGYEVLKEIKGDSELKRIPVIVLTTSSRAEDVQKSYDLGANNFITKGKGFTEFAKIITSIEEYWFKVSTLPPS